MGYELEKAHLEGLKNISVDAYMKARPLLDNPQNRKLFEAGFERAWNIWQLHIDMNKEE